jgi:cbb3-type cytochrome oxidase maturation protein
MEALFLLIPISVALVAASIWVFFRMHDSGQFDDMEGPAHSILMDDDRPVGARDPRTPGDTGPEPRT